MTAIRDAMTKAGIDTAAAELRTRAQEALKFNRGNVGIAADKFTAMLMKRRDLVGSLALQYLQRIAAEPEVVAAIAVDVRPKDVKVKQHARHRKRTTAEREAALRVAGIGVEAIRDALNHRVNDRPIGDFAWGELGTMVMENARDAASYLRLGTEATANALLLFKIKNHARVEDHEMRIRQVISATDMQVFIDEARAEAPRVVELGMHNYARTVSEGSMREIAA
jgi:hypothetical protein